MRHGRVNAVYPVISETLREELRLSPTRLLAVRGDTSHPLGCPLIHYLCVMFVRPSVRRPLVFAGVDDGADARQLGAGAQPGDGRV